MANCRGNAQANPVKLTDDVRKHAAQQGLSGDESTNKRNGRPVEEVREKGRVGLGKGLMQD